MKDKVLLLSGGVGGAKLAEGLSQVLDPEKLTIAVNTGDDFEHLGLAISPDIDSVTYMLAGLASAERGWGRSDETWSCMGALDQIGASTWFQLGDRDLAIHLHRSARLAQGKSLETVTQEIAERLGVRHKIVPMTEHKVRTVIESDGTEYSFQEYFVRLRCAPRTTGVRYEGAQFAAPSAGLQAALRDPQLGCVVIAPSNPILSIGPILAVNPVRRALECTDVPVVAVSPIINGRAVKGPAAKILNELNLGSTSSACATFYRDLIDFFVVDRTEEGTAWQSAAQRNFADILMHTSDDRRRVALTCLDVCGRGQAII
ncbi:2-phospho-L-lactate transferase [Paraburkholderia sp. SIMBA_030]|uniref:2-phospho-L-lactate transferase n=1 Tax=Paraburkholderia sp. SIMBA_030 TaxID=3085773 RepID=UPI0039795425